MAIDKDRIHQSQYWQLVMEISPDRLTALAFCPLEDQSLQWTEAALGGNTPEETLQSLENVVYDNPGLISDFGRVTVLWRTRRMVLMPGFVTGDDAASAVFRAEFPADLSDGPTEMLADFWEPLDVRLQYEVRADIMAFLRRTFSNPRVHHALTPAALWFAPRNGSRRRGKTLVNLGERHLDLYVLGEKSPLLVNTFDCPHINDALYYLLAVRRTLGLKETDEVIIAGNGRRRAELSPLLRRYVAYVLPAIFPAEMFRAGRGVLSAPFELGITPCTLN